MSTPWLQTWIATGADPPNHIISWDASMRPRRPLRLTETPCMRRMPQPICEAMIHPPRGRRRLIALNSTLVLVLLGVLAGTPLHLATAHTESSDRSHSHFEPAHHGHHHHHPADDHESSGPRIHTPIWGVPPCEGYDSASPQPVGSAPSTSFKTALGRWFSSKSPPLRAPPYAA